MRRSLAILAVSVMCGGGTVAVATAAYASDGDDGTTDSESGGSLAGWFDGVSGAVTSDDPEEETFTCRLPEDAPLPDLGRMPAFPKLSELPELLYSEQAVRDRDSGDVTYQVTQLGKVTDNADGALTVESTDGTAWTWRLTDDTSVYAKGREAAASSLDPGDKVLVHGTRDGDTRQAGNVSSPAPEIGLGSGFGPPERMRQELPDKLGDLLPRLKACDESQDNNGTGTAA